MKRFSPETCLLAIALVSMILYTYGCSNQNQIEETKEKEVASETHPISGGVYRMPLLSNPATLDPAFVQDKYGEMIVHQIFDCLVRFDQYLGVLPALAENWQVEDQGRVYRFEIRQNAKFHDGEPVTVEDVQFSISRLLKLDPAPAVVPHLLKIVGAEEFRAGKIQRVKGLEILSDKELRISLTKSHVPFLTALGMYQASIVPKKIIIKSGKDFATNPVGSGPFLFEEWKTDQYINLKRFEDYHLGSAYLEKIRLNIYPSTKDSAVLEDFRKGELDEMAVYGDIREKLSNQKKLQWFHRPSLSLFFYGMNCQHPSLINPNFRKALSAAIDRKSFVNKIYGGQFDVAGTILPPGMPGYNPSNLIIDNDSDSARQFLRNVHGQTLSDIPTIEMVSAFRTPRVEKEMELIKGYFREIDVFLEIKYIEDWSAFEEYIKSDDVQIYRYSWFADMPDPDSILHPLFASDSPNNYMKYQDEELDKMLQAARGIVDPVERAAMYQKAEAKLMDDLPLIPLFYMSVDRVYQPYVKGVHVSALGAHTMPLNKIWLDRSAAE